MKYIFVRHGKTHFNEIQLKQGWCDSPLTKQGIKEIENMAEQLKDYKIDAAYTSPILRAKYTAQIILKNHSVLLNEDDRLKEVNFGLLEGLPCLFVDKLQLESSNWLDDLQMDYTGYEGENVEDVIQRHFELLNDNCLPILDKFISENRKVDCIITSPPYNMNLRVMKGKYVSRCNNKNHKIEFSTKYENYNDDLSMEYYFNFQKEFIEKALKVSDLMFYNIQMLTGNKIALFKLMGYFADKIKEIIIWDKGYGQPAMQVGMLNSQFEFIIVFDNNKPYNRAFDCANFARGTETNIWEIKRERNKFIKAGFPTALIEKILVNFTNENDIILDPFMGSGTCGIVCKEMNRNFIGIELDKNMFKIAKERIENINK